MLFINLTNHPSSTWGADQLSAAQAIGEIIDLPFPLIAPDATTEEVNQLAATYAEKLLAMDDACSLTVHIMGEMTFTFAIVSLLKLQGIPCLASTTERIVSIDAHGNKVSTFQFVQFRKY